MNASRIYIVVDTTTNTRHLVKAISQAQAVRHVAADRLSCSVASGLEIAHLMSSGSIVADATGSAEAA